MLETSPLRVILYGLHTRDWMTALTSAALWKELDFVEQVLLVTDAPKPDIPDPVPATIRTVVIPLLETHTKNCPRNFPSLIPDALSLYMLGDKLAFSAYVRWNRLQHLCPVTYPNSEEADYPCILKRADLNGGTGISVVNSLQHLQSLLPLRGWSGKTIVLQSLVRGDMEYVTHCVCKDGRILWHCSFACEMYSDQDIRGPLNVKARQAYTISEKNIADIEAFLLPLHYTGPCNVDYKLGEDGTIIVFEINPRLGGTLMLPENVDYLREALLCIIKNAE